MTNEVDPFSSPEVVISAQDAVFWMDADGRWCNRHGPFQNSRIIDYFHRSIQRDDGGYFVSQIRDGVREKVYFRYAETPIFAVDVNLSHPPCLLLNTKRKVALDPTALFIRGDRLFMREEDEIVRFSERAMVKLSALMEDTPDGLCLCVEGDRHPIREIEESSEMPAVPKGFRPPA